LLRWALGCCFLGFQDGVEVDRLGHPFSVPKDVCLESHRDLDLGIERAWSWAVDSGRWWVLDVGEKGEVGYKAHLSHQLLHCT
jgi:hypothetical protein